MNEITGLTGTGYLRLLPWLFKSVFFKAALQTQTLQPGLTWPTGRVHQVLAVPNKWHEIHGVRNNASNDNVKTCKIKLHSVGHCVPCSRLTATSLRVERPFASGLLQGPRLKLCSIGVSSPSTDHTVWNCCANILNIFYSTCSITVNMFPLWREETQTALSV